MNTARLVTASLDDRFPLSRLPACLLVQSESMNPARRQQWRAGRALLAEALFVFAGCEMLPAMQISPQGKPSFVDPSLPYFSLSHSKNCLQLVLCAAGETGCDVEQMRPRLRYLDIARAAFSDTEFQWLLGHLDPQRAFWQLWCLREAWLKQRGGSVWQMDRIRLDPAAGLFTSQPDSDSRLWSGASGAVMTAVAVPGGTEAPEEYWFDVGSGLLISQARRVWTPFDIAL
ncbi:4'-phosphopantetheinyl transferase superfamily protein [Enterobacteriaceae bacterium Kacie_13]|nr:4'-phosphopantetheinyl transferase superfamily protein [Enterobacteriaceae bacterium Kacie_13]